MNMHNPEVSTQDLMQAKEKMEIPTEKKESAPMPSCMEILEPPLAEEAIPQDFLNPSKIKDAKI